MPTIGKDDIEIASDVRGLVQLPSTGSHIGTGSKKDEIEKAKQGKIRVLSRYDDGYLKAGQQPRWPREPNQRSTWRRANQQRSCCHCRFRCRCRYRCRRCRYPSRYR